MRRAGCLLLLLLLLAEARARANGTGPAAPPKGPAPPPKDEGADVVETLDLGEPTPPPTAPPPPPAPDRFQLNGWARSLVAIGFSTGFHQDQPDPLAVDYDQLLFRLEMLLRARYSRGRWFEATASGQLTYSLYEQNPSTPDVTFNLINGQSSRGVLETTLRELYLGFYTGRLDVRVGSQRLAWGGSDVRSPNDVLNARDLRDPLINEIELLHIPTFMLRGDLDLGFGGLQLVVQPLFTPDKFDLYGGGNWAIVQPDAPSPIRGFFSVASRSLDPAIGSHLGASLSEGGVPRQDLGEASAGVKFSWSSHGVDVNHYYQYGFDSTPEVVVDPAFARALVTIDFSDAAITDILPYFSAGQEAITLRYVRRHHIGTDLVTTAGPVVLRLEGAWDSARVFFRRDLQGFVSPTFEALIGVEVQSGSVDDFLSLEASYLRLLDLDPLTPTTRLLFAEPRNLNLSLVARRLLFRHLVLDLRALIGVIPFSYGLRPEAGVKLGALSIRVGAELLGGDDFSLGSYFRRNSAVYVLVKDSF